PELLRLAARSVRAEVRHDPHVEVGERPHVREVLLADRSRPDDADPDGPAPAHRSRTLTKETAAGGTRRSREAHARGCWGGGKSGTWGRASEESHPWDMCWVLRSMLPDGRGARHTGGRRNAVRTTAPLRDDARMSDARWIVPFDRGGRDMRELLGGKGA